MILFDALIVICIILLDTTSLRGAPFINASSLVGNLSVLAHAWLLVVKPNAPTVLLIIKMKTSARLIVFKMDAFILMLILKLRASTLKHLFLESSLLLCLMTRSTLVGHIIKLTIVDIFSLMGYDVLLFSMRRAFPGNKLSKFRE